MPEAVSQMGTWIGIHPSDLSHPKPGRKGSDATVALQMMQCHLSIETCERLVVENIMFCRTRLEEVA